MKNASILAGIIGFGLSGCTATVSPVQVTRFHIGGQIASGGIAIESATGIDSNALEFGTYAAAVRRQLTILGLGEATPIYSAIIDVNRSSRASEAARSPVSIGIGGGTGGGGLGVGIGTSFGIGTPKARQTIATRLSVTIKRRNDQSILWEGRAQTEAPETAPAAQSGLAADKLARALFNGFPGTSGETILVP